MLILFYSGITCAVVIKRVSGFVLCYKYFVIVLNHFSVEFRILVFTLKIILKATEFCTRMLERVLVPLLVNHNFCAYKLFKLIRLV